MGQGQIDGLVHALPLPAVFIATSDRIYAINDPAKTILGEGLTGRHYIHALRQPTVIEAIEACKKSQVEQTATYLGTEGRTETSYQLTCAYVAGDTSGVLVTFEDITDLKKTDQLRSDFVANVSHELRTPLTALMGFIETLQTTAKDDPKASERFLDIMASETSRMNRLVDDLLSLSRVEAQGRSRPTETVDIAELLGSIVHSLSPLAKTNAAELTLNLSSDQTLILGDGDQLRQVFVNLIENALKYGGEGVDVTVSLSEGHYEPL
ncbi:histidine kinase dimerization/phospho-acceptor domain-containing protein [Planktotalea sp.]|uniref:sensor histidine kinase n=1 Tax=Planktotalea sp. TaxID=2029877 RepID=UPI003298B877